MTKPTQLKTFLWFDGNLAEALDFYAKTFTDFKLHSSGNPEANGKLMTADFAIHGHEFIGMGWPGGPKFNDAISLSLNVDGQDEVDRLWDAITKDGEEGQCGWCKDKWGVNWQITPRILTDAIAQGGDVADGQVDGAGNVHAVVGAERGLGVDAVDRKLAGDPSGSGHCRKWRVRARFVAAHRQREFVAHVQVTHDVGHRAGLLLFDV